MKKSVRISARSKDQNIQLSEDRRVLLHNLDETKRELDLAYVGFNQCSDPDLIEFYLYEINALRARHTYLLRRIKSLEATPSASRSLSPTQHLDKSTQVNP